MNLSVSYAVVCDVALPAISERHQQLLDLLEGKYEPEILANDHPSQKCYPSRFSRGILVQVRDVIEVPFEHLLIYFCKGFLNKKTSKSHPKHLGNVGMICIDNAQSCRVCC